MAAPFVLAAIPRIDGAGADGVHLLWSAPPAAGYSLDGWDVQRRESQRLASPQCSALTPAQLDALHRTFRLSMSFATFAVRAAACPDFPVLPPDEPPHDGGPPRRSCVSLDKLARGRGANPRTEGGVVLEVFQPVGAPLAASVVVDRLGVVGLDCGAETQVVLPAACAAVELTLAHFSTPAEIEAFSLDGTSAGRVSMSVGQGLPETLRVVGRSIARMVIRAPAGETVLVRCCVEGAAVKPRTTARDGRSALPIVPLVTGGAGPAMSASISTGGSRCLAYRITLPEGHRLVEVHADLPAMLAIGLRDAKAVAAFTVADASGRQTARFENTDVDEVLLYASRIATALEVCLDEPPDPAKEDAAWAAEPYLVRGLQLPVRALDPTLASAAAEDALAASRLLPGETFDAAAFHEVGKLVSAAAGGVPDVSPVWATTQLRDTVSSPAFELRTWTYALATTVDPAWRRMLALGFLDAKGLTPGTAYDYRLTGRFLRRDLEEAWHGFQDVPLGTTLPSSFSLGTVWVSTPTPAVVARRPAPSLGALRSTGRSGLELSGADCLTVSFSRPVTRLVLELAAGSSLTWTATTTSFVPGLPVVVSGGAVPGTTRATLDTGGNPVDSFTLSGSGFLVGLREVDPAAGTKPDDVLTRSVALLGVVYAQTPEPNPPLYLGTAHLQTPLLPADPAAGSPRAPTPLGFHLSWLPPPVAGVSTPVPWPADLGAFPPFDVLGFRIERRRADPPGAYEPLDGVGASTLVLGSRSGRRDPPALVPGIDLEVAFPAALPPTPPVPVFMSVDDVLVSAGVVSPPPGSLHQYRVFSVDAIGRPSATAREGSVVRLEKHEAPPTPVGTPDAPPPGVDRPSGVRARAVQRADPDLTPDDVVLLGASDNAIVLDWGWTQTERDHDPWTTEFRVYWQPVPPDLVVGAFTGAPVLVGAAYEITAQLDRPVAADAMVGRYLQAPDRSFRVLRHTAGQTVTVGLAPSLVDAAAVPGPARFEFRPVLTGAEQRPVGWAERLLVVPLTAAESYQVVLRDRLVLDATHPRTRVWVGVSSADGQAYVPDELGAAATNGGRPGNESTIVSGPVEARYRGRPTFVVPPPLPDVPEVVTHEPAGDTVRVGLDLPSLLPGVVVPAAHRVLVERLSLGAVAACLSARADGTTGFAPPRGPASSYSLANPTDQTELLDQIGTGAPARVEGRFLVDAVLRHLSELEELWQAVTVGPVALGRVVDVLPHQPERYVHRVRLADPAGHLSSGAAIVPQVVRVPSLRSPAPPRLTAQAPAADQVAIDARVQDAFDLAWVLVFADIGQIGADDEVLRSSAQLLRLPNRRDLYPDDGIRLRLADGRLLAPAVAVAADTGVLDLPERVLTATVAAGFDERVALWGVAMTRDGITSRLAGPLITTTGPTPLVAPALTVTRAGGEDAASWGVLSTPALAALHRSTDAGATWTQVSPWLADGVTAYAVPTAAGATYRLSLRASRGRRLHGPTAVPT